MLEAKLQLRNKKHLEPVIIIMIQAQDVFYRRRYSIRRALALANRTVR